MRLLELRHVDGDEIMLAAVELGSDNASAVSVLPRRFGPTSHEHADRLVGIVEAGARSFNALADNFRGIS